MLWRVVQGQRRGVRAGGASWVIAVPSEFGERRSFDGIMDDSHIKKKNLIKKHCGNVGQHA